ncbi:brain-specific angiogenesis inhibitor 1-associated protein 2-like protein 1b isoform X2 [Phyllopteryx taeniolatus]|uniref:brain-specific angiogenesis inhibitor 1-associated protein 2-like protein 1b isoform X2 n=1 Tax=Phyllopteryx taeniolatus TaxID=161469 RepID=UPI002AD3F6D6|nr:brain-specific angiogenesis inhibitor 1-associated protein 2-like protein 1b isoform X2 [Phyllopteryx taeniolatus]
MSRSAEEVNKLTESTYKNVMEQFNPGLRNLVNLGKNYEKSVAAMTLAGRLYFDAMAKIGESAVVSPVSRELGTVLIGISEVHRKVFWEWEDNATFKRYQAEHKVKQDSVEKSQADLKRLRRKSQGKNAGKYENKESECVETLTGRQTDMRLFIADGCREALLEEKRRFCFLVDKHCLFSYQMASLHDKARDILMAKLSGWQDRCNDAADMPESVVTMIEGLRTPVSITPLPSPSPSRHSLNVSAPPAPSQKAHVSPLANMFAPDDESAGRAAASRNDAGSTRGEPSFLPPHGDVLPILPSRQSTRATGRTTRPGPCRWPRASTTWRNGRGFAPSSLTRAATTTPCSASTRATSSSCSSRKRRTAGCTAKWRRTENEPDQRHLQTDARLPGGRQPVFHRATPSDRHRRPLGPGRLIFWPHARKYLRVLRELSRDRKSSTCVWERPRRHGDDVHARTCEKTLRMLLLIFHMTLARMFFGLCFIFAVATETRRRSRHLQAGPDSYACRTSSLRIKDMEKNAVFRILEFQLKACILVKQFIVLVEQLGLNCNIFFHY